MRSAITAQGSKFTSGKVETSAAGERVGKESVPPNVSAFRPDYGTGHRGG